MTLRTRSMTLAAGLALVAALPFPGIALADVIFSDFSAGQTYDAGAGRVVSGGFGAFHAQNSPAYSFVASETASVTQIDVALSAPFGGDAITLWTSAPWNVFEGPGFGTTAPGVQLGGWVTSPGANIIKTISNISHVQLIAGTQYFLQISPADLKTDDSWFDNVVGATSTLWQCGDSDPTCSFGYISLANVDDGAFDVIGVPVPEPVSVAFFGAGMAGLGFLRRRKQP